MGGGSGLHQDPSEGKTYQFLTRVLDKVGDGTGDINANEDFSAAPVDFKIAPAPGEIFRIASMICQVRDSAINPAVYGADIVLANGIKASVKTDAEVRIFLNPANVNIKTNFDWGLYCYDASVQPLPAVGPNPVEEIMHAQWSFHRSGVEIRLDGDAGEYLAVTCNDDLTNLISHCFSVQGYQEKVLT